MLLNDYLEIDKKINNYNTIYIHSGTFHSDDLLSVAFMKILKPDINYKRIDNITEKILNEAKNGTALICDIGNIYDKENNLFDHHQEEDNNLIASRPSWEKDKNKTYYYSAFGLLWENFGEYYCQKYNKSNEFKKMFTDIIVRQIDACDNGIFIDSKLRKYKTNFPQIIKEIFVPTTLDKFYNKSSKAYDMAFSNALEYSEKYLKTHITNINVICNSNSDKFDKSLIGYAKLRKIEFWNIQKQLSGLLKTNLADENNVLQKYALDFINFNQNIRKIQSELTTIKNEIYKKINDIEVSKIVEFYEINKNYNLSEKNYFPFKISSSTLKRYYNFYHNNKKEKEHAELIHITGNFYNKELINKELLLMEYNEKKGVNFFIYDISNPEELYFNNYGYKMRLNDLFKNGGILILKCSNEKNINKDKFDKLIKTLNTNIFYDERMQKNISNNLLILSNLNKKIEEQFINPSENYNIQKTPLFFTYKERNSIMLKSLISNLCYKTIICKNVEKVNPSLYICKNFTDAKEQMATILLTTKVYSDIKIGKSNNYDLKAVINRLLNEKEIYEKIYNPELLDNILKKVNVFQCKILKDNLFNYNNEEIDILKLKIENKYNSFKNEKEFEFIEKGYIFEYNNKTKTKYLTKECDIVDIEKLNYYDDFEKNYEN